MRTLGLWVLILSALPAAPAWAKGKPKAKSKPDVVKLGFGWAPGLTADVTYRWTRSKAGKPLQGVSCTGRLFVAADGENLRFAYRDWKTELTGSPPAVAAPLSELGKGTTLVDKEGAIVRIDVASADDAVRLAAGTNASSENKKELARMMPIVLRQKAERTWQMLVGVWVGGEFEIGVDYGTDFEGPTDIVPGGKVKTNLRFRAERRLACPGESGKRCVELRLRSEPDRESMAKLVATLGERFGEKNLGSSAALGAVEETTLVTEPDRLLPHRLDITRTVEMGGAGADGAGVAKQVDTEGWTYQYPPASGGPAAK